MQLLLEPLGLGLQLALPLLQVYNLGVGLLRSASRSFVFRSVPTADGVGLYATTDVEGDGPKGFDEAHAFEGSTIGTKPLRRFRCRHTPEIVREKNEPASRSRSRPARSSLSSS